MLLRPAAAVAELPEAPCLVGPREDSNPLLAPPPALSPPRGSLGGRESGRGAGLPWAEPSAASGRVARLGLALRVSGMALPQSRGEDWEDLIVRDTVTGLPGGADSRTDKVISELRKKKREGGETRPDAGGGVQRAREGGTCFSMQAVPA